MDNFGTLVRSKRKLAQLTVRELAEKINVSAVYVTQIEIHNKLPSPEVFDKICAELKLDQDTTNVYLNQKYPEVFNRQLKQKLFPIPRLLEDTPSEVLRSAVNKVIKGFPSMKPSEQQEVVSTITAAYKKLVLTK